MKKKVFWSSGTIITGVISILIACYDAYRTGATWQAIAFAGIGAAAIFFRSIAKNTIVWKFVLGAASVIVTQGNTDIEDETVTPVATKLQKPNAK
jgi:hypothetical protein